MSLQSLKKEVRDKVYFLHSNKHQRLLQIDTILIWARHAQITKNINFAISL